MKFLQANVLRRNSSPEKPWKLLTIRQAIRRHFNEQPRRPSAVEIFQDPDASYHANGEQDVEAALLSALGPLSDDH